MIRRIRGLLDQRLAEYNRRTTQYLEQLRRGEPLP
jgi:hypothetical protein